MIHSTRRDLAITMSDGVVLAARLYLPVPAGPAPVLFAASPYRFDNDDVPDTGIFLWRETGPIDWYVAHGYAYVHLDVRGSGRSGGDYGFFDRRERRDLYEVIEWIAEQPWCTGKIGGIGHSYYAVSQWCMASERPPHLTCIAPYDGHFDPMGGWAFPGGIPGNFVYEWWNGNVRPINLYPFGGAPSRKLPLDLPYVLSEHPTADAYWEERWIGDALKQVTIPVFSIGVWIKLDLHLGGNIGGFERVAGPKKLLVSGVPNLPAAQGEFESVAFHERVLLPFYERMLKDLPSAYDARPAVEYQVRGETSVAFAETWPPAGVTFTPFYLAAGPTGSVRSLNDGRLTQAPPAKAEGSTAYTYPDPRWMLGHVTFGPGGPDPVARVLTFTTDPFEAGLTIAGPSELVLFLASTRTDADVIVKLSEQYAATDPERQPGSQVVSKGWLRASKRRVDEAASKPGAPSLRLVDTELLTPGEICLLRVPLMDAGYRLRPGSRLRIEVANADSPLTDAVFTHSYTPDHVGTDTIHHSAAYPSHLLLPVLG